jgi:hypothetical protein
MFYTYRAFEFDTSTSFLSNIHEPTDLPDEPLIAHMIMGCVEDVVST